MPLTAFQKEVLTVLAANRGEESHFAVGVVLNAPEDSARFSRDFDIFHEVAAEVVRASEQDVASLRAAGFAVETISRYGEWEKETTFRRARVADAGATVEIDWAADSAFRFFPIERDPALGWRLHLFDAATNKALTLAARTETRDYVDIVEFNRPFPLAAICWAACGKDPGFTPLSLLTMMRRFARVDPAELELKESHRNFTHAKGHRVTCGGVGGNPSFGSKAVASRARQDLQRPIYPPVESGRPSAACIAGGRAGSKPERVHRVTACI